MELSPDFAGTRLKEFKTAVEWRETMNYAAAVGDANPWYVDDTRDGGVVAPPMFAVALTWRISREIWKYIQADDFPMHIFATQVHYTERLDFHRLIRPGDKLAISGDVAAILPHRSGTHVIVRYRTTDAKGEPVFTNYTGAMLRGVKCTGEGRGADEIPVAPEQPGSDKALREITVPIHPLAPHVYDGCSDIFFPIHTSPKFATGVGLPGIILQGTATLAHAARLVVDTEAGGDPGALRALACRFTGMVTPGTDIVFKLDAAVDNGADRELFFHVLNAEGRKALSGGYARIARKDDDS